MGVERIDPTEPTSREARVKAQQSFIQQLLN